MPETSLSGSDEGEVFLATCSHRRGSTVAIASFKTSSNHLLLLLSEKSTKQADSILVSLSLNIQSAIEIVNFRSRDDVEGKIVLKPETRWRPKIKWTFSDAGRVTVVIILTL